MGSKIRSEPTDAQSSDTVFALLRNRRRRYLVSLLADRESPASLHELATAVAARESGTEADAVPAGTVDAVAVTLHHNHLPRLADANLVEYDPARKTVKIAHVEEVPPLSAVTGDAE